MRKRGQLKEKVPGLFQVRVYLGEDPATGKRLYRSINVRGTKREAHQRLTALLHDRDTGRLQPRRSAGITLNQYLDRWLKSKEVSGKQPRTLLGYEQTLDRYIRPKLGAVRVDRLSAQDILTVLHALKERGLGNTTIRACYTLLRAALNQAVEQRLIAVNPMNGLDGPPAREQREAGFMTPDQARRFLDEAALDPCGLIFAMCLYTGMRPGEARGLQWKDVDFTGNRIHVRHAVSYGKAGWYIKKPKSGKPRTVALVAPLKEALLLHRQAQALEKARAGQGYKDHDLVFANGLGTPLSESGLTKRHFKKILERAGLPLTLSMYSLRHTCATLALVAAPLKEVAEQLGHKDPALTARIYAHALPDATERVSGAIEAHLAPNRGDREGNDSNLDV